MLRRAGDLLRERLERIAGLMTFEQGKPLAEARIEVLAAADTLDWFAEEAAAPMAGLCRRARPISPSGVKEPVGPSRPSRPGISRSIRSSASSGAALAAGCSIIVKAPEETPPRWPN